MEDIKFNIEQSLEKGIDYLKKHQLHNGEFISYFSEDEEMKQWCSRDNAITISAYIGNSLYFLKEYEEVSKIIHKIGDFLEGQQQKSKLWNSFNKDHVLFFSTPNDIDDTVLIASLLKKLNRNIIYNEKSITSNKNRFGLYYTWFSPRIDNVFSKDYWIFFFRTLKNPLSYYIVKSKYGCGRYDIDGVVNANVLYYLGSNKISEPIVDFLINIIQNNQEKYCDKWYHNPFVVYYFISKNYFSGIKKLEVVKELIIERIMKCLNENGSFCNSHLNTGLAICTLINLRYDDVHIQNSIKYLLINQSSDGNWRRQAFYATGRKLLNFIGSEELTSTICIEAIYRYSKQTKLNLTPLNNLIKVEQKPVGNTSIMNLVIKNEQLQSFSNKTIIKEFLNRLKSGRIFKAIINKALNIKVK